MTTHGQPSLTALTAAAARAAHLIVDNEPVIFADTLAQALLGERAERAMIPAAAWDRSDSLCPAELSRIAHAAILALRADARAGPQGETLS